jgi:hypothetical protein
MAKYWLFLVLLVSSLSSIPGQEAPAPAAPINRIRIKSPLIATYKSGADVDVKAFLFRYVAPGFKPMIGSSHPRFKHALVITNIEPTTCESPIFHWDKKRGFVPNLTVNEEPQFLLIFSGDFPDEPEYIYMGEDIFVFTGTGSYNASKKKADKQAGGKEQSEHDFNKLGRKEQFEVLSKLFEPIWPFRPHTMYLTGRTVRGDKQTITHISAMRPPNFVLLKSEVDKLQVDGEVAATTCK